MSKPAFIQLPTYVLTDEEIVALMQKLGPFGQGDPEVTDGGPCWRARTALSALGEELRYRGGTVRLNADDTWTIEAAPLSSYVSTNHQQGVNQMSRTTTSASTYISALRDGRYLHTAVDPAKHLIPPSYHSGQHDYLYHGVGCTEGLTAGAATVYTEAWRQELSDKADACGRR